MNNLAMIAKELKEGRLEFEADMMKMIMSDIRRFEREMEENEYMSPEWRIADFRRMQAVGEYESHRARVNFATVYRDYNTGKVGLVRNGKVVL